MTVTITPYRLTRTLILTHTVAYTDTQWHTRALHACRHARTHTHLVNVGFWRDVWAIALHARQKSEARHVAGTCSLSGTRYEDHGAGEAGGGGCY